MYRRNRERRYRRRDSGDNPRSLGRSLTSAFRRPAAQVALLAVVLAGPRVAFFRVVRMAFVIGIVVFSGTLYALALSGRGWLGAITPVGGLAFLTGWAALLVGGGADRAG